MLFKSSSPCSLKPIMPGSAAHSMASSLKSQDYQNDGHTAARQAQPWVLSVDDMHQGTLWQQQCDTPCPWCPSGRKILIPHCSYLAKSHISPLNTPPGRQQLDFLLYSLWQAWAEWKSLGFGRGHRDSLHFSICSMEHAYTRGNKDWSSGHKISALPL